MVSQFDYVCIVGNRLREKKKSNKEEERKNVMNWTTKNTLTIPAPSTNQKDVQVWKKKTKTNNNEMKRKWDDFMNDGMLFTQCSRSIYCSLVSEERFKREKRKTIKCEGNKGIYGIVELIQILIRFVWVVFFLYWLYLNGTNSSTSKRSNIHSHFVTHKWIERACQDDINTVFLYFLFWCTVLLLPCSFLFSNHLAVLPKIIENVILIQNRRHWSRYASSGYHLKKKIGEKRSKKQRTNKYVFWSEYTDINKNCQRVMAVIIVVRYLNRKTTDNNDSEIDKRRQPIKFLLLLFLSSFLFLLFIVAEERNTISCTILTIECLYSGRCKSSK